MTKNFFDLSITTVSWIPKVSWEHRIFAKRLSFQFPIPNSPFPKSGIASFHSQRCAFLVPFKIKMHRVSLSLLLLISLSKPALAKVETVEIIEAIPDRNEGQVTLRVKAYDRNNKPVMGLPKNDFNLIVCPPQGDPNKGECQTLNQADTQWKIPLPEDLPPAWIIVLLDFSGSMKQLDSDGKQTKLEGAIEAIRKFEADLVGRSNNTQIAIVPFGEGGKKCPGNKVSDRQLNNFKPAGDPETEKYLKQLERQLENLCAATNIYEPLRAAIQFLGNSKDPRFNPPEDSGQPRPRLSVIVLSDGYHSIYGDADNEAELEAQDYEKLVFVLKSYPGITVHTLGYGLTPEQLQQKYGLNQLPTIKDLRQSGGVVAEEEFSNPDRLEQITKEEFVDQNRLKQIANVTRGIALFSGNAQDVASNLTEFLEAMFDEYEISYIQPKNADRGSLHNVRVAVTSPEKTVESEPKAYVFPWVPRSLPGNIRAIVLLLVLTALLGAGFIPFLIWAKSIKQEYQ